MDSSAISSSIREHMFTSPFPEILPPKKYKGPKKYTGPKYLVFNKTTNERETIPFPQGQISTVDQIQLGFIFNNPELKKQLWGEERPIVFYLEPHKKQTLFVATVQGTLNIFHVNIEEKEFKLIQSIQLSHTLSCIQSSEDNLYIFGFTTGEVQFFNTAEDFKNPFLSMQLDFPIHTICLEDDKMVSFLDYSQKSIATFSHHSFPVFTPTMVFVNLYACNTANAV